MSLKVGIFGTFDVENWGDLLFPLAASEALGKRLPGCKVIPWSYRQKEAGSWAYEVRSLADLADGVAELDAILIGGGHLIRFDKDVAKDYLPPDPGLHHPTSYWLLPALLGAELGIPVIWNGPSSSRGLPEWARPMLATALEHSSMACFRDATSISELRRFHSLPQARVIPDTAMGLEVFRTASPERTAAAAPLHERYGIRPPFVLVHASGRNNEFAAPIAAARRALQGYQFVEIEIGPDIGDRVGGFDHPGLADLHPVSPWPSPADLALLVATSSGVITTSLHLSLTAIASGRPVMRPVEKPGSKYVPLQEHEPIVWMRRKKEDAGELFAERVQSPIPSTALPDCLARLDTHWDEVAETISRGKTSPRPLGGTNFLAQLPFFLEQAACEPADGSSRPPAP